MPAFVRKRGNKQGSDGLVVPLLVRPMEGRTGSTFLMQVLGTSREIAFDRIYPYENRYLAYLARLVSLAAGQFDPGSGWGMHELLRGPEHEAHVLPFTPLSLDRDEFRRQLTRRTWQAFSDSVRAYAGSGVRYYAEKTWTGSADLLARAGIPFKMINLVRDPRDVLVSIREFDAKRGSFGFGRSPNQSDEEYLELMLAVIAGSLSEMDKAAEIFDVLLVRYEDLVGDLSRTARRLSDFIGVDLDVSDPSKLEEHLAEHATSATPSSSLGRWRREMAAEEAKAVEAALKDQMEKLGYLEVAPSPSTG